jgi:microcystin-dependent protein
MSNPYLGEIKLVPYNFAPRGWSFCAGQILPISSNTALFSLLGTTYGGNGTSTFALPDLRGRVPIHRDTQGLFPQGDVDGQETVTLTTSTMPQHNHAFNGTSSTANAPSANNNILASTAAGKFYALATTPVALAANSVGSIGSGTAHANMQPYLVMNYIIALSGVFPARN